MSFNDSAGLGNFTDHIFCGTLSGGVDVEVSIDSRSAIASCDQISGLLVPMASFGALNKLVYVQYPSMAGIKGTFASIDLNAKASKLFDMRKQLPADGLLVGFRQR